MRALQPRERRMFLLTVTVIGSALLYTSAIDPRLGEAARLHAQIASARGELAKIRSLIEHEDEIRGQADVRQRQISPRGDDQAELKSLLEEVEGISASAGLRTVSLRPRKVRDMGYYRLLSVELTVEGSQHHLMRFLHGTGGSSQLLRVDRILASALRQPGQVRAETLVVKILSSEGR